MHMTPFVTAITFFLRLLQCTRCVPSVQGPVLHKFQYMTAQFEELHVLRTAVFLQSLLLQRGAGAFVTVVSRPYDSF